MRVFDLTMRAGFTVGDHLKPIVNPDGDITEFEMDDGTKLIPVIGFLVSKGSVEYVEGHEGTLTALGMELNEYHQSDFEELKDDQ